MRVAAEQGIAFLIFALVAAVTPGPSNLMLTATGAVAGVLRGLPCLAGVAAGMGLLIFSVAMGLGRLVLGHAIVLTILKCGGAAFLLWLSWKIATASPDEPGAARKPVGFLEATAFQWINPKSWLVSASAAGTYLQAGGQGPLTQSLWFTALFVAAALPSGLLWLVFGASMQRLLRSARAARLFNLVMGASLAASVAMILL
jgi:threonine/homoserine/homoserine lactone efflux protein